jgi:hypothetical protein
MKLVEAEAEGPVEGDAPVVTPPPPRHRRVSISLVFTLTVLTGTVVAVYLAFPARHNLLVTEALARHRDPPAWDLAAPSTRELRAWAIGVAGKDVPLPDGKVTWVGARRLDVHDRGAALVRMTIGGDPVTYLVQHVRGIAPEHIDRVDGDLRAIAWTKGPFACIAVGPNASVEQWMPVVTRASP